MKLVAYLVEMGEIGFVGGFGQQPLRRDEFALQRDRLAVQRHHLAKSGAGVVERGVGQDEPDPEAPRGLLDASEVRMAAGLAELVLETCTIKPLVKRDGV
jgi:hypothetical protein